MRNWLRLLKRTSVIERMIQEEKEAALRERINDNSDGPAWAIGLPSTRSEEEERKGRRLRAIMSLDEHGLLPEDVELFTQAELDHLESRAIQKRWEMLWRDQSGGITGLVDPDLFATEEFREEK